jgi:hypothetical protein
MRVRRAAIGGAALLIALLGTGNSLALEPNTNPGRLDGVEEGNSGTFNLADGARVHVMSYRSTGTPDVPSAAAAAAAGTNGILYHGGPIVPAEKTVAIYWSSSTIYSGGPAPDTSGSGSADGSLVGYFLGHLGGSPYYNINTTYTDTVGGGHTVANSLSYTGFWADTTSAPSGTQNVSDGTIQSEIVSGFTSGKIAYDPSTVYAVFSSGSVNLGGGAFTQYCAYHGYFSWGGKTVLYAVMPYNYAKPSACSALSGSPNGDFAADAEVNTLAHELEEANTDPQLNAWYDGSGYENADKCAWTFGPTHTFGGGQANITVGTKDFLVQQNWLNANGGLCAQAFSTAPATVPGPPTLNSATGGASSVSLAWSAPGSNGGSAITNYKIYRGTAAGGEGTVPYTTVGNVTGFTDSAVSAGTTYYYTVAAVNSVGTSAQSNERSAAPTVASLPGAPVLTATRTNRRGVQLNWTVPTSVGSSISAYRIYRSTSPGGETLLIQRGASSTSYRDSSTVSGTVYYYVVTAVNASGEGPRSNEAFATAR